MYYCHILWWRQWSWIPDDNNDDNGDDVDEDDDEDVDVCALTVLSTDTSHILFFCSKQDSYNMKSLLPSDWDDFVTRMGKNQTLFQMYYKYVITTLIFSNI